MKTVGFRVPESDLIQRHKRMLGMIGKIEDRTFQLLVKYRSSEKTGRTKQTKRAKNRPVFDFYPFTYRLKFRQAADLFKHHRNK